MTNLTQGCFYSVFQKTLQALRKLRFLNQSAFICSAPPTGTITRWAGIFILKGSDDMRRINRHAQMRMHKRKQKKRYGYGLYTTYRTNTRLHEDECRNENENRPNARNGGYQYWQVYYLTGGRQYAKHCTNSAIRSMYRNILNAINDEDMDDVQALRGSDYEKMYDYEWEIW